MSRASHGSRALLCKDQSQNVTSNYVKPLQKHPDAM